MDSPRMFGWFDRAIKRGAEKGVNDVVKSDWFKQQVDAVVREELQKPEFAWFRFVKQIQAALMKSCPSMEPRAAFNMARQVYCQHLRDEKIEFGDPRFGWSAADARDLAYAYEIDNWEGTTNG